MTSGEIRQQFLNFFASKGHRIVPSASIVIKNDPTLFFTNAGMNQFKDYFLGNKKAPYPRVADTQKCLRVSGKHNDLEEVGVDTYHHTMFEMLGNWSFGDYFKAEAIAWSWELLTEVFKLDKNRLYVTVFEGDENEKLPKDEEAFSEWKKWISEHRILLGNKKDNFWEMGDTGPCGPCTEIHVDTRTEEERKQTDGKALVNADHPQVIEIWNNVFIEYNRLKDGSLETLPAKHVDTGMGFERLVRVLQNKQSNYDTDIFTGTIAETERITGREYSPSPLVEKGQGVEVAFRVIADHIRAIAFTIADGQLPSNTGAGYVIRRILRRAVRYYYSYLDYKQPLLFQLMPLLAKQFENVFPELQQQIDFVTRVVKEEEEAFLRTIVRGLQLFYNLTREPLTSLRSDGTEDFIDQMLFKSSYSHVIEKKIVPGVFAFKLTDTYGFPIDLINLLAQEEGWKVEMQEFEEEIQKQKQRSRAATAIDTGDWIVLDNQALNEFVGYDSLEIKSKVVKYRKVKLKGKEAYQIVLEATPFYGESGGQVGDTGFLDFEGDKVIVFDTKKEGDLIIHFTEKLPSNIEAPVLAKVNKSKRKSTAIHHSATHLLHAALRKILGTHVTQKGSLVNEEHLRFDFSHFSKVTDEEMQQIEALVNEKIRENIPVVIKEMTKDEAVAQGAMALFGEKYGDKVRVVIIDPSYSIELCGGTHVGATGELGFFKIKHETAVAAGVRRIEAISGKAAEEYITDQSKQLRAISEVLKNPKDIQKAMENLIVENGELKKKMESLEARNNLTIIKEIQEAEKEKERQHDKKIKRETDRLLFQIETIGQVNFIGSIIKDVTVESLKKICLRLVYEHLGNYFIILCADVDNKAAVVIAIEDDLANGRDDLNASTIIKKHVAPLIKGGGGGQKTLATAGGQDAGNLNAVIEKVKGLIAINK